MQNNEVQPSKTSNLGLSLRTADTSLPEVIPHPESWHYYYQEHHWLLQWTRLFEFARNTVFSKMSRVIILILMIRKIFQNRWLTQNNSWQKAWWC